MHLVSEPATVGLHPPGSHSSLRVYLRQLWERRSYLVHVPRNELHSRNMNTALGNLWNLLNPILAISVYFLVFGVLLGVTRGVEFMIPFLAIGVFGYQYTQRSTIQGSKSIVANLGLIRSISFPRAMLPLTTVITETLTFLPAVAVMFAVTIIAGAPFSIAWFLVVPLIALQFVFNTGAALVVARLNHGFRDIENILPFVFRLLFYGSGVLFYVDAYLDNDALRWLFVGNPLYCFLTLYRWAVLDMPAGWTEITSAALWTGTLLAVGLSFFRRGEASYGG